MKIRPAVAALTLFGAGVAAQATEADLRTAILADLAVDRCVTSRLPLPAACPVCARPLRELRLREFPGQRIDGPSGESARVCESDALYVRFAHTALRAGGVVPSGGVVGPAQLRLQDCDRTLGPLPWDAVALARAPSPAPAGVSVYASSADGAMVVGSRHDGNVLAWGKTEVAIDSGGMGVTGVALAPRADALALARNWGPVRVFSLPEGKLQLSVKAPSEWVSHLAFDPERRFLAMGCARGAGPDAADVAMLDLRSRKVTPVAALGAAMPTALVFADDGERLAIGDQRGEVRIWSTGKQRQLASVALGIGIGGLRFSPDGSLLAVVLGAGGEVHLLAAVDGRSLGRIAAAPAAATAVPFATVVFSADSQIVAFTGPEGGLFWCKVSAPAVPYSFFPVPMQSAPRFAGAALVTEGGAVRVTWDLARARALR